MKKLIAIALLTASTAAQANYEICSFYAKMMYTVTEQKNKGIPARQMFERANVAFESMPEFRDAFMSDIARLYKIKGYLAPEAVENQTLLNCLEGD